jgi:type II secretory pathway component GspD/PulD (secretin)
VGAEASAQGLTLPPQIEVAQLVGLVGEMVGVSIHYDPQKITGTVRLEVRQNLTPPATWSVLNQVILQHGFTTVVAGQPAVYHVVPISDAEGIGTIFTDPADAAAVTPPPGYLTILQPLTSISPESAIQALSSVLGQKAPARAVGKEGGRVLISGDRERVLAGSRLLLAIDRPGNEVAFRTYEPRYTSSAKLMAGLTAAWGASAKVSGRALPSDVQMMPDGQRLLVIATNEELPKALRLLEDLDRAEPTTTKTYRSEHFRVDDLAQLIEQVLGNRDDGRTKLVRDHLTGGLLVTASDTQHERIAGLLADLEASPVGSRQELRTFVIKNRQAADLAGVLRELTANGLGDSGTTGKTGLVDGAPLPPVTAQAVAPARAQPQPEQTNARNGTAANPTGGARAPGPAEATFTVDPYTNSLIVLGTLRYLERVTGLVDQLDRRQPQVEVEVTFVVLSDDDTLALGVEWARITQSGDKTFAFSQLFGLSKQGTSVVDRSAAGTGLTSLMINPGNYAAVIQALKTVNHGRNVVTSKAVVTNNEESTIDAVLQQPIANINSSSTVSTTSYGGTSDAGTKIKIKPLISAADQVQLTFTVSQSAFVGESTKTNDGAIVPPPKRQDSLASIVSVPDGHVIALGGLSNQTESQGHSGVPWLSDIPLLGSLFRSETKKNQSSRFYLFIKADVLRHPSFEDLKLRVVKPADQAGVDVAPGPKLQTRFLE